MKLIYLNGKYEGRAIPVNPPGISIGRESDNDVVLAEELASRYHAKLTYELGVWHLLDLDSSNGTQHNGNKISGRVPLSIHDEIRIGEARLVFTDDSGELPAAMRSKGGVGATATDGGKPRKSHTGLLLIILAVVLVAIGTGVFMNRHQSSMAGGPTTIAEGADAPLEIYFETYTVSNTTIYRFELTVHEGRLRVLVDDLYNRRHEDKELPLTEEQLAVLEDRALSQDFLALRPEPKMPSSSQHERVRLMVMKGRIGNYLDYENVAIKPPAFDEVREELEDMARSLLGIFNMTRAERLEMAQAKFTEATLRDEGRSVDPSNLYRSIELYDYVLIYLEGLADPPAIYKDAFERRNRARRDLDEMVEKHMQMGEIHRKAGKAAEARAEFQQVMDLIPNRLEPRALEARKQIERIQREIDKTRRNR